METYKIDCTESQLRGIALFLYEANAIENVSEGHAYNKFCISTPIDEFLITCDKDKFVEGDSIEE
jgi:hypothetical protein